jgi:hypothetical protein
MAHARGTPATPLAAGRLVWRILRTTKAAAQEQKDQFPNRFLGDSRAAPSSLGIFSLSQLPTCLIIIARKKNLKKTEKTSHIFKIWRIFASQIPKEEWKTDAGIAQLVEHDLAKVGVASSSLVSRSLQNPPREGFFVWCCPGGGIGRHAGLKILFLRGSAGSSPAPGTFMDRQGHSSQRNSFSKGQNALKQL